MLVQCEFYEVDGELQIDVICERCGEVAAEVGSYAEILPYVYGERPGLCDDCLALKCRTCGKFAPDKVTQDSWKNGICWECKGRLPKPLWERYFLGGDLAVFRADHNQSLD